MKKIESEVGVLGLFLLVSISYFFYSYPDAQQLKNELSYEKLKEFEEYNSKVKRVWLESLIIGFLFSFILFLLMINRKI